MGNKTHSLSVWRVLKGPNDDWPLALCDFQTVNFSQDVMHNDCLHQTRVGENWLLQANETHQWYYLSAQEESDLIVFRNTDSKGRRACELKKIAQSAVQLTVFRCIPRLIQKRHGQS